MLDDYFRQYALLAIFAAIAVAVPTGMLLASWMMSLMKILRLDILKIYIMEINLLLVLMEMNMISRFYLFT